MSRWRVSRSTDGLSILLNVSRWEVRTQGGNLVLPRFRTHAEAIAHADRMARTCEVTLPAPIPLPPVDVHRPAWHVSESMNRPWVASIGRFVHVSDWKGWGEQIDADRAEKYGLALLAAAKHAKGELP